MAAQNDRGIPLSALNPKFLHTNSTSHSWPFSAIAELIDNAHDPDVNGRQFWIDKTRIGDQDCLTFMDNGAGMDYDKMFKMLSFGFSDKVVINNHHPIGLYGNGFKSGSMRLGKDAIVFSRKRETMCVGMLSQTYLQEIQAENIFVPIVTFKRIGESIRPESQHAACLKDILQYSLFKTEEDLLAELEAIKTHDSKGSTGTRIIIWNIRKTSTNKSEFDFEVDRYDIKIPADVYESEKEKYKQYNPTHTSSPEIDYSLRAYCSVLYLKPKMQINIRGSKVKSQLISKSLAKVARDSYKPIFLKKVTIPITFGYNPKSKEHYGVMMYHRNRLIKAYERVGCQKKGNNKGVGVIAVIECNFLKPTHNKQDFDHTDEYRKIIHTLGVKLEDYWKAKRYEKGLSSTDPEEDIPTNPDQKWVQCNDCQKWRKLPDGINVEKLPEEWFCRMNPDTEHRGCDKPEEAEDSEDETSSCLINYRQHERNLKRQQEQKKMQEQQRNVELTQQNDDLRRTKEDLIQKLQETSPSPSRSSLRNFGSSRSLGGISSPPQSNQMPVITGVMSLSSSKRKKSNLREKSECQALKKARILKGFCNNNADKPSTSKAVSYVLTSDMEISNSNDSVDKDDVKSISDNDGDDDDIVIDETKSTPKPKAPTFDLANVKFERITSNDVHNSDPVSIETPITSTIPTTSTITTDPLFSSGQASITTQTECGLGVKMEEDQQRKEEMELKREQVEDAATHVEICSVEETNRSLSDHVEIQRCKSANLVTIQSLSDGSVRQTGVLSATAEEPFPVDPNPNIYHIPTVEAQEQQDNLLELMNVTAQERDEFKMKVQSLTLELDKKELKLLELTVKREFSHKYIQTDPVHEKDFETLYLQAKQHNEKLTQTMNEHKKNLEDIHLQMKAEKEAQDWMKSQAGPSKAADLEDDMALQMGVLLSELDQRNSECNDLKSKLDCLEEERNRMQKDLEELRKNLEECRNTASSANHVNQMREEGETNERSEEGESIVIKAKLRDLRRSVARLLVTFVPALDPEQVNYDCDVIDEILNQVIQEIPSATTSS